MNQYSAEFYYQYPGIPQAHVQSQPISHLSSSHAKISNLMNDSSQLNSAPQQGRILINGGLQLNIVNSAAADRLNGYNNHNNNNIKVQKNLLKLKEVANN